MDEIWILVRNLEHRPECAVRRDRLPWRAAAAVAVDSGFAVTRMVSKRTMVHKKESHSAWIGAKHTGK